MASKDEWIHIDQFIVLDIETTGINCKHDKIIEIAAVKYDRFQEVASFSTLINPLVPLPRAITTLTGITQADLDSAPTWDAVKDEFLSFIGGLPLIGHNIYSFDIRFIEKAYGCSFSVPLIDTLELSRHIFPEFPTHKLGYLANAFGIEVKRSHRALDDVRTTCALLEICLYEMARGGSVQIHPESVVPLAQSEKTAKSKNNHHYHSRVDIKSIQPTCECTDSSSPLCGKNVVFTGTLSMPREEAMQRAVNAGAILKSGVSKKTDFLVVGQQDVSVVGSDGMSSKEEKAHELNDTGKANIKIISEEEFLALLSKEGVTT